MLLRILVLLLLATPAAASSITLTIPDAKDALVVEARDLFNARTGQSLTTRQYVMALVRAGVANELAGKRQRAADAELKAARDATEALERQKVVELDAANQEEGETTWGLPATPVPTPVPTPTVPVIP